MIGEVSTKKSHLFKSNFIPKMYKRSNRFSYKRVADWSKNVPGGDIFSLEKVFVPYHVGNSHWTFAVIFMKEKLVQYHDSLGGGSGGKISNNLIKYLKFEWKSRKRTGDFTESSVDDVNDVPQQYNGCNYGVFTCMF